MDNSASEAAAPAYEGEAPLTTAEKQWLKEHWGGEWKFLQAYRLDMTNDEERAEGRAIVRAMMKHDK